MHPNPPLEKNLMAQSQIKPKQLYHDYWHIASCHCLDIQTSLIIALLKLLMLKNLPSSGSGWEFQVLTAILEIFTHQEVQKTLSELKHKHMSERLEAE